MLYHNITDRNLINVMYSPFKFDFICNTNAAFYELRIYTFTDKQNI